MSTNLKHAVLGTVAAALVAVPAIFGFATSAHADTSSCLLGLILGKTTGTAVTVTAAGVGTGAVAASTGVVTANKVMAVPTSDVGVVAAINANTTAIGAMSKANAAINTNTSANTQGLTIQRCIVEPLVTIMARAILANFTAQTVKWINSGFKGSPMFVTNPQGFMSDVADQAIGSFIQSLGPIGSLLCSPFDLQLRLALNLQFSSGSEYPEYIGCRLSDIEQNVQRAFTGGTFGSKGWESWIKMTATPQNNPYGAYIKAVDAVSLKIGNTQYSLKTQLDWGRGFLSSVDPATGKITTPGSIIESQLSTTLGVPVQNIGLARDLDAILNALVGQMINQVMGGVGGLLGASSGGSQSAVNRGRATTPDSIIAQNTASQNLPEGVLPSGQTPAQFCQDFSSNLYANDPRTNLVQVKIGGVLDKRVIYSLTKKTVNGVSSQWTLADYNQISSYCQNINVTQPVTTGVTDFTNTQTAPPANEPPPTTTQELPPQISLATDAILNQSYVGLNYGPSNAASNPNSIGSVYSSTKGGAAPGWWTAYLGEPQDVETIRVQSYYDTTYTSTGLNNQVVLGNIPAKPQGVPITPGDVYDALVTFTFGDEGAVYHAGGGYTGRITYTGTYNDFTVTATPPVKINAIVVSNPSYIMLTSVKAYRPAGATAVVSGNSGNTSQQPIISFSPGEQSLKPNSTDNYNSSHPNFSATFTTTGNQPQNNLSVRTKFFRTTTSGDQPTAFTTVFAAGSLKINDIPVDTAQNTVTPYQNITVSPGETYIIAGNISNTAVFNDAINLSYKIVTELFSPSAPATVIASQATTFKVQ